MQPGSFRPGPDRRRHQFTVEQRRQGGRITFRRRLRLLMDQLGLAVRGLLDPTISERGKKWQLKKVQKLAEQVLRWVQLAHARGRRRQ